jgi:peptide/nickel transport system substrate-binding protein
MRALVLIAAASLLAAACAVPLDPPPSGDPEGGGPPHAGGVLRLAGAEDPRTLDPARGYDTASWSFEQMLFSTLVRYDDEMHVVPDLAESWTTSPDGRLLSFTLRRDVRFSTGRAFGAADVKYSLERVLRPAIHSQGAEFFQGIQGAKDYVAGRATDVRGIQTPAPDRVEFTLVEVDPLFLQKLTMLFAAVVDREAVERVGDEDFTHHPVGTGPFVLAEWTYGQRLRLERNPLYFRPGVPRLDGVDVTIGVSPQLAWLKYQRGELDLAGIPSAEFQRVQADARYRPLILSRTRLDTQYVGLNCEVPPFDRVAVRQAMNLAIDKQRLIELIDGQGVIANGILPPDMPGAEPVTGFAHDPAAARRLLEEAGLGKGFETTMWASRDEGTMRLAQSMQQDLRAIGVRLRFKPVDFPALIEAIRQKGMVPLFLLGWEADFPDPSNFLTVLLSSKSRDTNNNTFYSNPEVDKLLDEAEPVLDLSRRFRLFHEAEVIVVRDAPWIPLFYPSGTAVRHPRVRDYRLNPLRPARLEETWIAG